MTTATTNAVAANPAAHDRETLIAAALELQRVSAEVPKSHAYTHYLAHRRIIMELSRRA